MKIGIMGAMLEEVESIKHTLDVSQTETSGYREYTLGKLQGTDIVLVFSRWGKVAASSTVTTLITKYSVNAVIFIGVAGAIEHSLNIGDIVVAECLYQHDMDARPLFEKHQIPLTTTKLFTSNAKIVEHVKEAISHFLLKIPENLTTKILDKYAIHQPKVMCGKIASGDQFVSHLQKINELRADVPDVLAVEMEGAAVAQVCDEHGIPFVVIRIISDKSDHRAKIDFQAFIKEVSSKYSCGIIGEIFKKGFKSSQFVLL